MKALIVADDLGYCPRRNRALFELLRDGKVSRCSLLVNVDELSRQGAQLCQSYASRIGLHFNLTEGAPLTACPSLTTKDGLFRGKEGYWSTHLEISANEVEAELRAQIARFVELVGVLPAYIDGHQHVHCSRRVLPAVVNVMAEYEPIKRLRVPIEPNWSNVNWIEPPRRVQFYQMLQDEFVLASKGLTLPVHLPFVGYSTMGDDLSIEHIEKCVASTDEPFELMVHPGYCADEVFLIYAI